MDLQEFSDRLWDIPTLLDPDDIKYRHDLRKADKLAANLATRRENDGEWWPEPNSAPPPTPKEPRYIKSLRKVLIANLSEGNFARIPWAGFEDQFGGMSWSRVIWMLNFYGDPQNEPFGYSGTPCEDHLKIYPLVWSRAKENALLMRYRLSIFDAKASSYAPVRWREKEINPVTLYRDENGELHGVPISGVVCAVCGKRSEWIFRNRYACKRHLNMLKEMILRDEGMHMIGPVTSNSIGTREI